VTPRSARRRCAQRSPSSSWCAQTPCPTLSQPYMRPAPHPAHPALNGCAALNGMCAGRCARLTSGAARVQDENTPASRSWFTWRDTLHIVDIVCCCAVLFPIVWSIAHLRAAAAVRRRPLYAGRARRACRARRAPAARRCGSAGGSPALLRARRGRPRGGRRRQRAEPQRPRRPTARRRATC